MKVSEFIKEKILIPVGAVAFLIFAIGMPLDNFIDKHGWLGIAELVLSFVSLIFGLFVLVCIYAVGLKLATKLKVESKYNIIVVVVIFMLAVVIIITGKHVCPPGPYGDYICGR